MGKSEKKIKKGKKLRLWLSSTPRQGLLNQVENRVKGGQKTAIFTPNPEFVILAKKDRSFGDILSSANINLPDGSYLFWAREVQKRQEGVRNWSEWSFWRRLLASIGWGISASARLHLGDLSSARITGADFMIDLCCLAEKNGWSVFLLGAAPGVAQKASTKLKSAFPKLKIAGTFAGDGKIMGDKETKEVISKVTKDGQNIHFLFVAYGMGKQERWINRNLSQVPVGLAMGVGGSFDYLVKVSRAPQWLQRRGLEWFYRLLRQPWRLGRQIRLLEFVWLVLSEQILLSWRE